MQTLKVSANSNPKLVAGALAAFLKDNKSVEIQAIGAAAVNQAVKSIAVTRGYMAPTGVDLICIPAFSEAVIEGEQKTAIKFIVEVR